MTPDENGFIESVLMSSGSNIFIADDLCGFAAGKDPKLLEFANNPGLIIIACQPRAVKCLLFQTGISENILKSFYYFNIREKDV